MLVCSQLALFIASLSLAPEPAPLAQPVEPSLVPSTVSTTELISREFSSSLAALPQGTMDSHAQPWFVSGGYHYIAADYSVNVLGGADFSDKPGYSVDVGFTKWSDELGVALEGGVIKSSTDVDIGAINSESVDSLRLLVGVRAFDRGSDTWLPYIRGGFMWRTDDGDSIEDSGSGWYLGGGFDFYLGAFLRAGPQLLYTDSSSLNAKEWILGAVVTFAF